MENLKDFNKKEKIKSLDDLIRLLKSDDKLLEKVKKAKDATEVAKIVKADGYDLNKETKDLLEEVSGGWHFNLLGLLKFGDYNENEKGLSKQ